MRITIALLVLAALIWVVYPAIKRWRESLCHCPELKDAGDWQIIKVFFEGMKTKLTTRLMVVATLISPAVTTISQFMEGIPLDLSAFLPTISIFGMSVPPGLYGSLLMTVLASLAGYFHSISKTKSGTISADTAFEIASQSTVWEPPHPSPMLQDVTDMTPVNKATAALAALDPSAVVAIEPALAPLDDRADHALEQAQKVLRELNERRATLEAAVAGLTAAATRPAISPVG